MSLSEGANAALGHSMKVLVATLILLLRLSTAAAAGNTTNRINAELFAADPLLRKSVHQHATYARMLALAARASPPTPEKFTVHTYQTMYGAFLLPLAKAAARDVSFRGHLRRFLRGGSSEPHFKVLEMGMGCHLSQGPGAAIHWWQEMFPMAERWFSEQDEDCVARARAAGQIPRHAHVLLGDRGSRGALDRWVRQAKGTFDVVIDSISQGGYEQTKAAFDRLWPTLPPGGLYFMENLSAPGRWAATQSVAGMLQCYMEQLLVEAPTRLPCDWPIPPDLSFVFCQDEACVVGKSSGAEVGAPGHALHAEGEARAASGRAGAWRADGIRTVYAAAARTQPASRKFTAHAYETMYGTFLGPLVGARRGFRLLEVGADCAASFHLWRRLFPRVDLWFGGYTEECARQLSGLSNRTVLPLSTTAPLPPSDAVILSAYPASQALAALERLWASVRPGGLLFIEGLAESRRGGVVGLADALECYAAQSLGGGTPDAFCAALPRPAALEFVFCQVEGCALGKSLAPPPGPAAPQPPSSGPRPLGMGLGGVRELYLRGTDMAPHPVSDKLTDHTYETMYGLFLGHLVDWPERFKMLEIGLGCGMGYGPGASFHLWEKLFPLADLWFVEYNEGCVADSKAQGLIPAEAQILVGDQANFTLFDRWVAQSWGAFDVVIDNGGHTSKQIANSFQKLWPTVLPGGLYFIENLQVSRWFLTNNAPIMDTIECYLEQLLVDPRAQKHCGYTMPADVAFVFCQLEACVLGKALQPPAGGLLPPRTRGAYGLGLRLQDIDALRGSAAPRRFADGAYEAMYGLFLGHLLQAGQHFTLLEVARGCGPDNAASFRLWRSLFDAADVCVAEDGDGCGAGGAGRWSVPPDVRVVSGPPDRWVRACGRTFDVVVDAGGHNATRFGAVFAVLWPRLRPSGLYFVEGVRAAGGRGAVPDVIQCYAETLVVDGPKPCAFPRPVDLGFVFCQRDACVLGKALKPSPLGTRHHSFGP